jgi:hypothetical protein
MGRGVALHKSRALYLALATETTSSLGDTDEFIGTSTGTCYRPGIGVGACLLQTVLPHSRCEPQTLNLDSRRREERTGGLHGGAGYE